MNVIWIHRATDAIIIISIEIFVGVRFVNGSRIRIPYRIEIQNANRIFSCRDSHRNRHLQHLDIFVNLFNVPGATFAPHMDGDDCINSKQNGSIKHHFIGTFASVWHIYLCFHSNDDCCTQPHTYIVNWFGRPTVDDGRVRLAANTFCTCMH